jgi:hypothetical protein
MRTWPDGTTSRAHHQTGQDLLMAKPYHALAFKEACQTCHTTHRNIEGLPYQLNKDWYTLEDGEGCMECHGSNIPAEFDSYNLTNLLGDTTFNGRTVMKHTMHTRENSQCVNCHFSKTATISFTYNEFSTHSFKLFRPTITNDYASSLTGMFNTCASECHRNGRGNRNWRDTTDEAPDFGITDTDPAIDFWKDAADIELADTLWFWYKKMYPQYVTTSVQTGEEAKGFSITSIAPNPTSDQTTIRFDIDKPGDVSLEVWNASGERIKVLTVGHHARGSYTQQWDGTDELYRLVPSGNYWVRIECNGRSYAHRVVIAR